MKKIDAAVDVKAICSRLKEMRERLGFNSAKAFSENIGLKYSTYNGYEVHRIPPTELLFLIKSKYMREVDLNWLISGNDDQEEENDNITYIDAATRILNEVVEETDTQDLITDKVKQELVQVIREEIAENENRTREKFFRVIRAMAGG